MEIASSLRSSVTALCVTLGSGMAQASLSTAAQSHLLLVVVAMTSLSTKGVRAQFLLILSLNVP
jgi:hypothetical protein